MDNDKTSRKKRVLLAEDDASMRRFLEITLNRAGYDVVSVADGLSAMKTAHDKKFDAVITDAVMPHLSGHDLCRMLRQNSEYDKTPLIILSGMEQEISLNAEHDCADEYLVKDADLKDKLIVYLPKFITAKSASQISAANETGSFAEQNDSREIKK